VDDRREGPGPSPGQGHREWFGCVIHRRMGFGPPLRGYVVTGGGFPFQLILKPCQGGVRNGPVYPRGAAGSQFAQRGGKKSLLLCASSCQQLHSVFNRFLR